MEASIVRRLWRFPRKPWADQRRSILFQTWRVFPGAIVPVRLPFGAWWLAQHEYSTDMILNSGYEKTETDFVQKMLQDGMTVLDVGANRGYYAMLASRRVGPHGRVIGFEPSPRERKFLKANLLLSRCRNVTVEPIALGSKPGQADLYVVDGYSTGCNCLRPRDSEFAGKNVHVAVRTLDEYTRAEGIRGVDLLKIDIEGGELEVIKGAGTLLRQRPRPIILCEMIDQLTHLWGYEAREIVHRLQELAFRWFDLLPAGQLAPLADGKTTFDGNYVAVPEEKLASVSDAGWIK